MHKIRSFLAVPWNRVWAFILVLDLVTTSVVVQYWAPPEPSVMSQVFRAFVDLGGVLIGLVGLVGIFTLSSNRSAVHEMDRGLDQLERDLRNLELKIPSGNVPPRILEFLRDRIILRQSQRDTLLWQETSFLNLFFAAIALFTLQIFVGILGLAYSSMINRAEDWWFIVTVVVDIMVLGNFCTYFLVRGGFRPRRFRLVQGLPVTETAG